MNELKQQYVSCNRCEQENQDKGDDTPPEDLPWKSEHLVTSLLLVPGPERISVSLVPYAAYYDSHYQ